jgi:DNA-binding SARP family transcriptional activator
VALHALRQTLAGPGNGTSELGVLVDGSSYQLAAPDLWLDVEEFERCYSAARALEVQGRKTEALGRYEQAAQLYRGDFLEDLGDEWPAFRREALKDQLLHVLASLAGAAFERGDYLTTIASCQQMLSKDPCREDTYRLLMLSHGRLGQPGRVRSWYTHCLQTLRTVLDAPPSPDTEDAYRAALRGVVVGRRPMERPGR